MRGKKRGRPLVSFWSGAIRESPSATSNLSITRESNDDSTHQASHHRNFQATSQRHEVYNNHRRRSHAFGRRVCLLCRGGKGCRARRRDCGAARQSESKNGEGREFNFEPDWFFYILMPVHILSEMRSWIFNLTCGWNGAGGMYLICPIDLILVVMLMYMFVFFFNRAANIVGMEWIRR